MTTTEVLTIAIPAGALYDDACDRLARAGLAIPAEFVDRSVIESGDTRILVLPPTDIPGYVEFGAADCAIVGADAVWETGRELCELGDLEFGARRLVVAVRREDGIHRGAKMPALVRVATSFARSAQRYFASHNLPVHIVHVHGAVEVAIVSGLADAIVDLIATESTLQDHDLVVVDEIATSTARFVVNPMCFRAKYARVMDVFGRLVPA